MPDVVNEEDSDHSPGSRVTGYQGHVETTPSEPEQRGGQENEPAPRSDSSGGNSDRQTPSRDQDPKNDTPRAEDITQVIDQLWIDGVG